MGRVNESIARMWDGVNCCLGPSVLLWVAGVGACMYFGAILCYRSQAALEIEELFRPLRAEGVKMEIVWGSKLVVNKLRLTLPTRAPPHALTDARGGEAK